MNDHWKIKEIGFEKDGAMSKCHHDSKGNTWKVLIILLIIEIITIRYIYLK